MNAKITAISVIAILLTSVLQAQKDFQSGYIVTNSLDTINGSILSKGDRYSAKVCSFKRNDTADEEEYGPETLTGYHLENGKYYISKEVPTNDGNRLLFVEYLLNGIMDLFYYRDTYGDHYLIESQNGELLKLETTKEKLVETPGGLGLSKVELYKGMLKYAMRDTPQMNTKIESVSLQHKALTGLMHDYHNLVCSDQECVIYEKQAIKGMIKWYLFCSGQNENVKISNGDDLSYFDNMSANILMPGIGIEVTMPSMNEKLSFRSDIAFGKSYFYSYRVTDENIIWIEHQEAQLHQSFLSGDFLLNFKLSSGKIKPSVFGGFSLQRTLSSDLRVDVVREKDYEILSETRYYNRWPGLWHGLAAGFGMQTKIKPMGILFCNFKYSIMKDMDASKMQTMGINIGLIFNKKEK